ncbi:hypothetical protein OG625_22670 [Streptomyces sp. NBC_01351]|uniref:hypothetical protein n=1 Tax=Streptomyces sp. NBC_01351 TaxID=2903833 RepID=UPI002E2EB1F1|nr:hypothetical protein [Streptomyces sp. NBC_01351]
MKRSLIMSTAAVVTGLTLFATACTEDGSSKADGKKESGKESSGGTDADNALKMRQCLREHGIDAPDPEPGQDPRGMTLGAGADPQKMQEAMKACGMDTGPGKEPTQEEKDKELKWIRCMRDNGIQLKDPEYNGGARSGIEIPKGQEKAFQDAVKKCEAAR